ncbi:MAG: glutamate formimidoyltransferase [Deltaproteobacteria bacterium]|nr:glutamate formimidoyltransferase [Deltaproteobacteria bacterium]
MKILMSVPNISEGRDLGLVNQVIDEIRSVPGVRILDYSSDADHNRSVLTYLGPPEAVLTASQKMAVIAFELIAMSRHQASHPSLGAVDVAPFIPIKGVSTADVVGLAKKFGRFVGELGVPVYYYEDAASRPERTLLTEIRKGEYEALPAKLNDPTWAPDEGPAAFNPKSGAMVTGARFPLVAFNVNLRTDDLKIAKEIAKSVRHINGGYRFVRAIGLELSGQGQVQVSMNLTNYLKTPVHRVLETIRSEAGRYGNSVAGGELVGPVPLGALEEVLKYYLQVHEFSMGQIIENTVLDMVE